MHINTYLHNFIFTNFCNFEMKQIYLIYQEHNKLALGGQMGVGGYNVVHFSVDII